MTLGITYKSVSCTKFQKNLATGVRTDLDPRLEMDFPITFTELDDLHEYRLHKS